MHFKKLTLIGVLCITLSMAGCTTENKNTQVEESPTVEEVVDVASEGEVEVVAEQEPVELEPVEEEINLQEVKPNEVGEIMVVMYHSLGAKNDTYIRTVESFKNDLEMLYEKGYRPISMTDYIANNIEVEPGFTPIVLTFDDGHVTNFNIIDEEAKTIDPNCSLGLMESFNEMHPDFGLKAIFYLNGGYPFKQKELVDYKLNYLIENGLEIGNHSYGHENFKKTSASNIEVSLGKNVQQINSRIPNANVTSLALPFGSRPASESNYGVLVSGSYEDTTYNHTSILNVGWRPTYPSIHTKFNPESINRVRAGDGEFELAHWVEYFEQNPSRRYISDGDAELITVRESDLEKIDTEKLNELEIRTYTVEE